MMNLLHADGESWGPADRVSIVWSRFKRQAEGSFHSLKQFFASHVARPSVETESLYFFVRETGSTADNSRGRT